MGLLSVLPGLVKWLSALGLVLVGGYVVYSCQHMDSQKQLIATTRDTLAAEKAHRKRLQVDSTALQNAYLVEANKALKLEADFSSAQKVVGQMQGAIDAGNQTIARAVASMSALQKKHAADLAAVSSRVSLNTTVEDSAVNGLIARLDAQVRNYRDSVTPELIRANALLQAQNLRQREVNVSLNEQRNAAVEAAIQAESSWVEEAATARFLGKGRRRHARLEADRIRTIRQQPLVNP